MLINPRGIPFSTESQILMKPIWQPFTCFAVLIKLLNCKPVMVSFAVLLNPAICTASALFPAIFANPAS